MSYSKRLAVCEAFSIVEVNGIVRLEVRPSGRTVAHFALAETGTFHAEIALALEVDRKAALESDD